MESFDFLQKTLLAILDDVAKHEDPAERLCDVAGMIKPEVVATAIRLMEVGKVRELTVQNQGTGKKCRNFESFSQKTVFDRKSELKRRRKKQAENLENQEPCFIEVEHAMKKESLQFLYPGVHFCTCRYFQMAVLEKQSDWICVHLLSYYISRSFSRTEFMNCSPEITGILRKILLRSVNS